ncbi:DUF29 domain-containing protein [Thiomonas sp.]
MKPDAPGSLYNQDFHAWTQEQAAALRHYQPAWMDWENAADELESMGKWDRREVERRIGVILMHLMKWGWQSEKRSSGWRSTIVIQRKDLAKILEQSPSLRQCAIEAIAKEWQDARRIASIETGLPIARFPRDPSWGLDAQVLADWWPE